MAASTAEQKALEWLAKGDKAMKKSFFSSADPATAAECYEKAANMYKLDKQWVPAGSVFERAAACLLQCKDNFGAARHYQAASLAYRLADTSKAESALSSATALFVEEGKMSMAAKTMRDLSELQEKDNRPLEALESLQKAIDFHDAANEPVAAAQLKTKAAPLAADAGDFVLASEFFEDSARNATMSSAVVDYYFRAALCHLVAGDTVETSKRLERYGNENIDFLKSAECAFLDELIKAIETYDKSSFEESSKVFAKNSRNRLDAWKTKMLLRIKDNIPDEAEEQIL